MQKTKYLLAVIFLAVLFSSCSKDYSLEVPGANPYTGVASSSGTAVFTLSGAPNACVFDSIYGNYTSGTALDSSDKAEVVVNVTTPGTYFISTGTSDGFSFNGSGTFSAIGTQTITLIGTGSPIDPGSFSFTPDTNGCSFIIPVAGTGSVNGYFITGSMGGNTENFDYQLEASNVNVSGLNSMSVTGKDSASGATFVITLNSLSPISAGTYNLLSLSSSSTNFCTATYVDVNSVTWGGATGSQSNAFSVIVTSVSSTDIQGSFSGMLYNNDGAGTVPIAISGGLFNVPVQ